MFPSEPFSILLFWFNSSIAKMLKIKNQFFAELHLKKEVDMNDVEEIKIAAMCTLFFLKYIKGIDICLL